MGRRGDQVDVGAIGERAELPDCAFNPIVASISSQDYEQTHSGSFVGYGPGLHYARR